MYLPIEAISGQQAPPTTRACLNIIVAELLTQVGNISTIKTAIRLNPILAEECSEFEGKRDLCFAENAENETEHP